MLERVIFAKINIFTDCVFIIGLYTHKVSKLSKTSLYTNWAKHHIEIGHFQHNYWKSRKMTNLLWRHWGMSWIFLYSFIKIKRKNSVHNPFVARLHFSAEELLLIPPSSPSASASASTWKMLGQMLKSWNFSLSIFFVAFNLCLSY